MDKLITFTSNEVAQARTIEEERTQALAQIGALYMDLDAAKKGLDTCNDRRTTFFRQVLANSGIHQFESARATKDGIVVTIPNELIEKNKPNGAADAMATERP